MLYTKWLSYEKVLRLKRIEEMVELYYNSGQFTAVLPFLEQAFESPFAMYEALADDYEANGYFVQNPARSYRYEILLQFALKQDAAYGDCYRELLTFDVYLRENAKSRPDFARDTRGDEGVRERIRAFYQKEAAAHCYLPAYANYDWKQMSRMTHLEPFSYPVWDAEAMQHLRQVGPKEQDNPGEAVPYFVLFDYQKRNPLNYEAQIQIIAADPQGR